MLRARTLDELAAHGQYARVFGGDGHSTAAPELFFVVVAPRREDRDGSEEPCGHSAVPAIALWERDRAMKSFAS